MITKKIAIAHQAIAEHPALFASRSGGYACDVQSRLDDVKCATDPDLLTAALNAPNLQKTVRTAIERKIKQLNSSGPKKTDSEISNPKSEITSNAALPEQLINTPLQDATWKDLLSDACLEELNSAIEQCVFTSAKSRYNAIRAEIRRRYAESHPDSDNDIDTWEAALQQADTAWINHFDSDTSEVICHFPMSAIDGTAMDLQMRSDSPSTEHISDLSALIEEGTILDPVDIYVDTVSTDATAWIADGWHRYVAHQLTHQRWIRSRIRTGGREAAWLASLSANASQRARPRTRADLRKAVTNALGKYYFKELNFNNLTELPNNQRWTLEKIAELCSTTKVTVHNVIKAIKTRSANEIAKAKAKDQPPANAAGEQLDFLDLLARDTTEYITRIRTNAARPDIAICAEKDPRRAADILRSLATELKDEAADLIGKAKAIESGIAASTK
jgi:hypothetical protein